MSYLLLRTVKGQIIELRDVVLSQGVVHVEADRSERVHVQLAVAKHIVSRVHRRGIREGIHGSLDHTVIEGSGRGGGTEDRSGFWCFRRRGRLGRWNVEGRSGTVEDEDKEEEEGVEGGKPCHRRFRFWKERLNVTAARESPKIH